MTKKYRVNIKTYVGKTNDIMISLLLNIMARSIMQNDKQQNIDVSIWHEKKTTEIS